MRVLLLAALLVAVSLSGCDITLPGTDYNPVPANEILGFVVEGDTLRPRETAGPFAQGDTIGVRVLSNNRSTLQEESHGDPED